MYDPKLHIEINGLHRTYCGQAIFPTTKTIVYAKDLAKSGICQDCIREFQIAETIADQWFEPEPKLTFAKWFMNLFSRKVTLKK